MILRGFLIDLTVMGFLAIAFALLGPFGTFAMPLSIRLLYWLVLAIAGYAIFFPAMRFVSARGPALALPMPGLWAATCLAMSAPMTIVVWLANHMVGADRPLAIDTILTLYFYIVVVSAIVCLIFWFRRSRAETPMPQADSVMAAAAPSPFLDRLPPHLGRDLIALEMEDHYVRAHTTRGSDLILLRLRDAVAELGGVDGAQVHRSWWVARDAIEKVARDGRNVRLELRGGLTAPVARNVVPELREQGWL
ncbi:LytTR family transcriptional regulator [Sphingomonas crocodyli]|uniref:LytTR family transcriptional regulator n=2 Tax=Sphingomonas crocodyli TaxID=1979270 RepID=A0A437MBG0_9SPHN|nr:LytTR family transcriptional regulator [Sphingomonas crocodyli]